jgi:hypothetical protein
MRGPLVARSQLFCAPNAGVVLTSRLCTADLTGPITSGRILLYRFNLAYENAGSFRDFTDTERICVPPIVTWNLLASYAHAGSGMNAPARGSILMRMAGSILTVSCLAAALGDGRLIIPGGVAGARGEFCPEGQERRNRCTHVRKVAVFWS